MTRRPDFDGAGVAGYPNAPPVDGRIPPSGGRRIAGWTLVIVGLLLAVTCGSVGWVRASPVLLHGRYGPTYVTPVSQLALHLQPGKYEIYLQDASQYQEGWLTRQRRSGGPAAGGQLVQFARTCQTSDRPADAPPVPSSLSVQVTDSRGGHCEIVGVRPGSNVRRAGHDFSAVAAFSVSRPGRYYVSITGDTPARILIGRELIDVISSVLWWMAGTLAGGAVAAVGVVMLVRQAARRRSVHGKDANATVSL